MRVVFAFEGREVGVVVRDDALAQDVCRLFPGARIEDSTDRVSADKELGSGPDGFFFRNLEERVVFASVPDLLAAVEFALVTDLLAGDGSMTHLHAAGAGTPQGAILVAGPTGAGKSSIALAWSLLGLPLYGDDVIRMDEDGFVVCFPRLLKVHPDQLEEGGVAPDHTPFWDPDNEEVWFDPMSAGGWADEKQRVAVLGRVQIDASEPTGVRELDEAAGLRLLLDSVQTTGLQREQNMDRFVQSLRGVRVFDVRVASSSEAARRLVEIIDSGQSGHVVGLER